MDERTPVRRTGGTRAWMAMLAGASAGLLLVGCLTPGDPGRPPEALATRVADRGNAAPPADVTPRQAPAPWTAPRSGVPPGALLVDHSPRDGWTPGRPGAGRGALVPLDPETGGELPGYWPVNAGHALTVAPSPDGRLLALLRSETQVSNDRLLLTDRTTWREPQPVASAPRGIGALTWSRDGSTLFGLRARDVSPGRGTEVWAFDVDSGDGTLIAETDFTAWDRPLLGPDGAALYLFAWREQGVCCGIDVQGDPFIAAVDVDGGAIAEIPLPGVVTGQRFEPSPDGAGETNVLRFPATAIGPDGSRLFIAHADEDRITVVDLERREVTTTFTPERRRSALERLGSWLLARSAHSAEAKGGAYFTKQAAVSADGRWLYVTGTRDEVCAGSQGFPCIGHVPIGLQVIDAETLDLVAEFDDIGEIAVSPDGRWVVGIGTAYDYGEEGGERATRVGYGLTVIDARSLRVAGRLEGGAYTSLAVSPDSRFAYMLSRGPGYEPAVQHGRTCKEACFQLTVFGLPGGEHVATRDLVGWLSLVSLAPP